MSILDSGGEALLQLLVRRIGANHKVLSVVKENAWRRYGELFGSELWVAKRTGRTCGLTGRITDDNAALDFIRKRFHRA